MEIKVLGSGCPNCKRLEKVVRQVVGEMGIEATLTKVTDFNNIMAYKVTFTPGLVINEQVVSAGRIPSKAEVTTWLVNALAAEEETEP